MISQYFVKCNDKVFDIVESWRWSSLELKRYRVGFYKENLTNTADISGFISIRHMDDQMSIKFKWVCISLDVSSGLQSIAMSSA